MKKIYLEFWKLHRKFCTLGAASTSSSHKFHLQLLHAKWKCRSSALGESYMCFQRMVWLRLLYYKYQIMHPIIFTTTWNKGMIKNWQVVSILPLERECKQMLIKYWGMMNTTLGRLFCAPLTCISCSKVFLVWKKLKWKLPRWRAKLFLQTEWLKPCLAKLDINLECRNHRSFMCQRQCSETCSSLFISIDGHLIRVKGKTGKLTAVTLTSWRAPF